MAANTSEEDSIKRFRLGSTPGSFRGMGRVVIKDMGNLTGKSVTVTAARKRQGWAVIPEGATSPSAVEGDKLAVDDGLRMPVKLVDVKLLGGSSDHDSAAGARSDGAKLGKCDAFRAERFAWSVILPDSKPGSATLVKSGDLGDASTADGKAWEAPVKLSKVVHNQKEQIGLFASRPFSPGDCIFVEAPLLQVPEVGDVAKDLGGLKINMAHKKAIEQFLKLPMPLKQEVLQLASSDELIVTFIKGKEKWSESLDKDTFFEQLPKLGVEVGNDEGDKAVLWKFICAWDCNCIQAATATCLFRILCRSNHSCRPNASRVMLPGNQMAFVAIREISLDEEICSSYLLEEDLLKPLHKRQQILSQWGFQVDGTGDTVLRGSLSEGEEAEIEAACAEVSSFATRLSAGATLDISEKRLELEKLLASVQGQGEGHWLLPSLYTALKDIEELDGNYTAARDHQAAVIAFWDQNFPASLSVRRPQLRGQLGDLEKHLSNYMAAYWAYREGLAELSSFQFPAYTGCQELKKKLECLLVSDKGAKVNKS